MSDTHLNNEMWAKLSSNQLDEEENRRLREHLDSDCEECASFLSGMDEEIFHDHMKSALPESACQAIEPGAGEMDAVFRKIADEAGGAKAPSGLFSFKCKTGIAFASLAAAALVLYLAVLNPNNLQLPKGDDGAIPSILLQVAVLKHNADSPTRCISGGSYDPRDILFFRYELTDRGYVYLIRLNGNSQEIIYPPSGQKPQPMEKGVYDFREGKEVQGFLLSGLKGRQSFIALASVKPLDREGEIAQIIEEYRKNGTIAESGQWSAHSFTINVGEY